MEKIFAGQSALRLLVHTGLDLSESVDWEIRWEKPSDEAGSFPAFVVGEATEGVLGYEVQEGDLDEAGWWRFWAWVGFSDGRRAPGCLERVFVWEEGR